jgi:hypothetical protein
MRGSAFHRPARRAPRRPAESWRGNRGSILIIVLVSIVLTAAMITLFIDKASTDLIIESRHSQTLDLRKEAYSATEVTLAVLQNFVEAGGNAIRSPREGWDNPLEFAEWTPPEGLDIEVTFEDESGKISLPNADANTLTAVFEFWEMSEPEAQELADALLGWMRTDYTPLSAMVPEYELGEIPYAPPGRSLLSFDELAAIDVASTVFYDEQGAPNALWRKFADTFSLYDFDQPNINALPVRPEAIVAIGQFDATAVDRLTEHLTGDETLMLQGSGYFRTTDEAVPILGLGNAQALGTQIQALRINVLVRQGGIRYRLSVLVAPPNGAEAVQSPATNDPTGTSDTATAANAPAGRGGRGGAATGGAANTTTNTLQYPFTVLEIRETMEPFELPAPEDDSATDPIEI